MAMAASPHPPTCPFSCFYGRRSDNQAPFCWNLVLPDLSLHTAVSSSVSQKALARTGAASSSLLSSSSILYNGLDENTTKVMATSSILPSTDSNLEYLTNLRNRPPPEGFTCDEELEEDDRSPPGGVVSDEELEDISSSDEELEEILSSDISCLPKQTSHRRTRTYGIGKKHPSVQKLAGQVRQVLNLYQGKRIHSYIKAVGLEQETYLANLLISMYHRFEDLENARAVFDVLQYPSVVSWNSIIRAYVKFGHIRDALQLFRQMLQRGHRPNRVTFLNILGACNSPETLAEGKWIHAYSVKEGFKKDIAVCNSIISMYGRCGDIKEAVSLFNYMKDRNVVTWNCIIAAYCKNMERHKALELFAKMQQQRLQPDHYTFVGMLTMFDAPEYLAEGKEVHNCIIDHGYHTELIVGNALISMYNKCGSPEDAFLVFKEMSEHDVISWSAMIDAYAQHGHGRKALELFQVMEQKGIKPNRVTFISLLTACAALKDAKEGKLIHSLLKVHGIPVDVYLGNALMYMYGKCGALKEAQAVFDEMHARDSVTWTIMLHAYASNKCAKETLQLFDEMRKKGVHQDKSHSLSAIDACGLLSSLKLGKALHEWISKTEFCSDIIVGNALISMYGRCGALKEARAVFNNMHKRDVVSYNSMLTVYAEWDYAKEAFECFTLMQANGMEPTKFTFIGLLSACKSSGALLEGKAFHKKIIECGFEEDVVVGNSLINMYGRCGAVEDAFAVFEHLQEPDLTSWNLMIATYCNCLDGRGALRIFRKMQEAHVKPDKLSYLSVVGACTMLGAQEIGRAVHRLIQDCGWESDMVLGGALVNMFGKLKALKEAQEVFDQLEDYNVVSWTTIIEAYSRHGCFKEATELLKQMQRQDCQPNKITLVNVLSSCMHPDALEHGIEVHSYIIEMGFESELVVGNALVTMYGRCQALDYACQVFSRMIEHDVVSWTTFMSAFLRCRQAGRALQIYDQMQQADVQPNQVTFGTALKACAILKCLEKGKSIHATIRDAGYGSDMMVKQALTNMYHSCDAFEDLYLLTS